MKRIIIAGSRNVIDNSDIINNIQLFINTVVKSPYDIEVIQGGARGVDSLAKQWANAYAYVPCIEFKADWDAFGKPAGHIRNQQMADYACEEEMAYSPLLIAFPSRNGKGTQDMIRKAIAKGMDIVVKFID